MNFQQWLQRTICFAAIATVASTMIPTSVRAQAAKAEDFKKGSEAFVQETSDGVFIALNYWQAPKPSTDGGVVMLLHSRGGSQRDLFPLAKKFNEAGLAVVTFDFRGHGESRSIDPDRYGKGDGGILKSSKRPKGDKIDETVELRTGKDFTALVRDIDAVKEFLHKENNAGRLNLRRMGIVAAGDMACTVALQYAKDEFLPPESGRRAPANKEKFTDIAALVLINPTRNYRGLITPTSLQGEEGETLPIFLISSDAPKSHDDGANLARSLRLPDVSSENVVKRGNDREKSGWYKVKSPKAGSELLFPAADQIDDRIVQNVSGRLAEDPLDRKWVKRQTEEERGGFGSKKR